MKALPATRVSRPRPQAVIDSLVEMIIAHWTIGADCLEGNESDALLISETPLECLRSEHIEAPVACSKYARHRTLAVHLQIEAEYVAIRRANRRRAHEVGFPVPRQLLPDIKSD